MLIIWFEVFLFGSLLYVTETDTVRLLKIIKQIAGIVSNKRIQLSYKTIE